MDLTIIPSISCEDEIKKLIKKYNESEDDTGILIENDPFDENEINKQLDNIMEAYNGQSNSNIKAVIV